MAGQTLVSILYGEEHDVWPRAAGGAWTLMAVTGPFSWRLFSL